MCFSLNEQDSRRKAGSIGFPNFYIEARVVDQEDQEWESWFCGPGRDERVLAKRKGDVRNLKGRMAAHGRFGPPDEEGYFYVVGRKKEMFISGVKMSTRPKSKKSFAHFPEFVKPPSSVYHIKSGESAARLSFHSKPDKISR